MTDTTYSFGAVVLEPGDLAPPFTLPDADGNPVSLADYAGRRVVLFFYPKAATPGCTTEACDFRDSLAGLRAAGIDVLGLSPDPLEDLRAFRDTHGLTYPLLSDPGRQAIDAYGLWGERTYGDRTFITTIRSTFVVGPDGRLEHAWYEVKADGHVADVRTALGV